MSLKNLILIPTLLIFSSLVLGACGGTSTDNPSNVIEKSEQTLSVDFDGFVPPSNFSATLCISQLTLTEGDPKGISGLPPYTYGFIPGIDLILSENGTRIAGGLPSPNGSYDTLTLTFGPACDGNPNSLKVTNPNGTFQSDQVFARSFPIAFSSEGAAHPVNISELVEILSSITSDGSLSGAIKN